MLFWQYNGPGRRNDSMKQCFVEGNASIVNGSNAGAPATATPFRMVDVIACARMAMLAQMQ